MDFKSGWKEREPRQRQEDGEKAESEGTEMKKALIVIPARYGSTRFPGKILASLRGKPMIQWVWEAARRCKLASDVVVATDDRRIFKAVEDFGGYAMMTKRTHHSGTDRIAEVAKKIKAPVYVNVQGDEPLLKSAAVDALIAGIGNAPIATLAHEIESEGEWQDPNVVNVVFDRKQMALYFSRAPIPFQLDFDPNCPGWRHVGIYAFKAEALKNFVALKPSSLERIERLEQLRALENGMAIKVLITKFRCLGVDTPEDLAQAERILVQQQGKKKLAWA
jgi:3-deoxy-manno-octulosonate cytidylyltransferase (CMP-KDO synthetase)